MYKTEIIECKVKTKKIAEAIEKKANEMEEKGYKLITFSITNSGKAIILFHNEENDTVSELNEE